MSIQQWAAIVASTVLVLVMILQLLLAAGLPLGRAAWRGQHRVLPRGLRWASLATVGVLGLAAWVVLARVGLAEPGAAQAVVPVAAWVFAGLFALNTLGNITSQSVVERFGMGA